MDYTKKATGRTIIVNKGDRYGKLVIIQEVKPRVYKRYKDRRVLCKCDCGNTKVMSLYPLVYNKVTSCGCSHKEQGAVVGKKNLKYRKDNISVKLHSIWRGMICRCNTASSGAYKRYGAKGVRVCEQWANDFNAFYEWAVSNGYSYGLTIDRIDYTGNYEPSNCRWVDYITQCNNRSSNVRINLDGEEHTLTEWSRIRGIKIGTIYSRKRRGWDYKKSLLTPVRRSINK